MFIAKNKNGKILLSVNKPVRKDDHWLPKITYTDEFSASCMYIPENILTKKLSWEDEPIEVECFEIHKTNANLLKNVLKKTLKKK